MFRRQKTKQNYYPHFIAKSLNFKTAKLLKLGVNSRYHMAHAEPDTSMSCLNFESPALWPIKTYHDKMDTNSQECAYGPTHYKLYSPDSNVSTERLKTLF